MSTTPNDSPHAPQQSERRSFFARFGAIGFGTIVAAFPFAAGWSVVTSPLRRGNAQANTGDEDAGFVRICPLDSLPADGVPHPFPVAKDVVDAWTRSPNQRIGEVFLSRTDVDGKPQLLAFTATCPHLGCAVEFDGADDRYECPCHESGFAKNGEKLFGPSLRGLDSLEWKIKEVDGPKEIWVRYEQFRTGIAEKEPIT